MSALHCGQKASWAGSSANEATGPIKPAPLVLSLFVSLDTNPVPLDDCTARQLAPVIVKVAYPLIN